MIGSQFFFNFSRNWLDNRTERLTLYFGMDIIQPLDLIGGSSSSAMVGKKECFQDAEWTHKWRDSVWCLKQVMLLTDRFEWIHRMMQKDKLGQDMFLIG